jgi:argininosuccinate synthase
MIENRRVGIKSREVYETPAALSLITAHGALEDLTLEREVGHFKAGIEPRWADLVYDGLWFSPLREGLDAFIDATQESVTGDVRLEFSSGSCTVAGRRSNTALYDRGLATYGAGDLFDQRHSEGFIRLWGLPLKVWSERRNRA